MRIAIIGAGNVGKALGTRLASAGHEVVYGVRDPARDRGVPGGAAVSLTEAARAGVLLLAVPWTAAEEACRALGDLSGRIVIDCTNPLGMVDERARTHDRPLHFRQREGGRLVQRRRRVQEFQSDRVRDNGRPVPFHPEAGDVRGRR